MPLKGRWASVVWLAWYGPTVGSSRVCNPVHGTTVVALYTLIGALTVGAARNPGRVTEAAGVFPFGVLLDPWAWAFVCLLCVISSCVYV